MNDILDIIKNNYVHIYSINKQIDGIYEIKKQMI